MEGPALIVNVIGEKLAEVIVQVSEWFGKVIYDIEHYGEIITEFPITFSEFIGEFVQDIILEFIALPGAIGEVISNAMTNLLHSIFVPDAGYIQAKYDTFLSMLRTKFGFDSSVFQSLFYGETPVEDVYVNYGIKGVGTFNLKVLDASFVVQGVNYFRPFIRGFLVLLMFLFHVKQVISFFGYDAGVVSGRSEAIAEANKEQKG